MKTKKAFTLIELLVTIAIVGIMSAIAMAAFGQYRARGNDANANQDLRSAATAQEAQYVDTANYIACTDRDDCITKLIGVKNFNEKTIISMTADAGNSFEGTSSSTFGSGRSFHWNNTSGLDIIDP